MTEDAPQRTRCLREVFNGGRWIARAGAPWRLMPNDLPPWEAVDQQTQRWLTAGVFEAIVHDLRMLLRLADGPALGTHARESDPAIEPSKWPSSGRRWGQTETGE
jgi:transposase